MIAVLITKPNEKVLCADCGSICKNTKKHDSLNFQVIMCFFVFPIKESNLWQSNKQDRFVF